MKSMPLVNWFQTGMKAWFLAVEASQVIGLRMVKIAVNDKNGKSESERMVTEKIAAALEMQGMALTGKLGQTPHSISNKTLAHYQRKVRANRRRLLKE
jgi:hypothetical protein